VDEELCTALLLDCTELEDKLWIWLLVAVELDELCPWLLVWIDEDEL
jgi:hypothetical protein